MPTTYSEYYLYVWEQINSDLPPTKEFLELIYDGTKHQDQYIRWICCFTARNLNHLLFPKEE
jgi:hypothetical protein